MLSDHQVLVPVPDPAAAPPDPDGGKRRLPAWRPGTDALAGSAVAVALCAYSFVTTGGVELGSNTWAEIVLVLIAAGLGVTVWFRSAPGRAWGAGTVLLFAALTVLTIASIAWSVEPATSWTEANRTVSYLAAFGGAVALARLVPGRWAALVGGIGAGAAILSGYALIVKVFPGTFDPVDTLGRLRLPFGYWNAVGLMAALGLPACLWAGARSERARVLRGLAPAAISVLITVVVLSYSRSALATAVIGLVFWFAVVPLRLRAAAVLALGAAGAAVLTVWALATRPLTHDNVSVAARTGAGHSFGLLLVVVVLVEAAAGVWLAFALDRVTLPDLVRRRIATALLCLVALAPVAGIGALAASSRGLTGEISHVWDTLTSSNTVVGPNAGRLLELGNSRSLYWHLGLKVGDHALLKGVGAGGYSIAQGLYTSADKVAQHAHSYEVETFADFGLLGALITLALFVAWVIGAARAVAFRHAVAPEHMAERAGLLTAVAIVIVYGLQASVDWTWFIPGTTVAALVCAGWLAGRGPLARPVGLAPEPRASLRSGGPLAAVLAVTAVVLLGAWAMLQPLRSSDDDNAALSALVAGNTAGALNDARTASNSDPVDYWPLWIEADVYQHLHDHADALAAYRKAATVQPENWITWLMLGDYELKTLHRPLAALPELEKAHELDLGKAAEAIDLADSELHRPLQFP